MIVPGHSGVVSQTPKYDAVLLRVRKLLACEYSSENNHIGLISAYARPLAGDETNTVDPQSLL